MTRKVAVGRQSFEAIRSNRCFYVDKTSFICEWWESQDDVTLICRPRRFGKTLTLDTVRCFFSTEYADRGDELFGGLAIWDDPAMRALQGTVPVVSLSFARCKSPDLEGALASMRQVIRVAVEAHGYLQGSTAISEGDRALLARVSDDMDVTTATTCLGQLCSMLKKHWGKSPIVLLDEYDTPLQEAWLAGYWNGMSSFVRQLFNATFKTNEGLGRGLITGIARVASESIFSDLNNPAVVTTTTRKYQEDFGFTDAEVRQGLAEYGLSSAVDEVRSWYDGFTFGDKSGIYNPWSITNYLDQGELDSYWANSSSNALVSELVREGDQDLKSDFETLLAGGSVSKRVDERVQFRRLRTSQDAVWSLLLAAGYLRVNRRLPGTGGRKRLELAITNREVMEAFDGMVTDWFSESELSYNRLCRALLAGDVESMCHYLTEVTYACVSSFDGGTRAGERSEPERFYHGLVLGMLVELRGRYAVKSNRESGLGRYDVMLVPNDGAEGTDPAIVIEFKVFNPRNGEKTLEDTVEVALAQIADKDYSATLVEQGITQDRIHCYGMAFRSKEALVGGC